MANKDSVVAAGGIGLGSYFGGVLTGLDDITPFLEWVDVNLTAAGLMLFLFVCVLIFANYFIVSIFITRDNQKREDIKEAFGMINTWADKVEAAIKAHTEATTRFRIALAQGGFNEDVPKD